MELRQFRYKFMVLSRRQAEEYSRHSHKARSVIISIYGSDEGAADIRMTQENNIKLIRFVQFDDISKQEPGLILFNQADAMSILMAIAEAQAKYGTDGFDRIIVHCGAGISRSAGTAAALMYILTGSSGEICDNPKYRYNSYVYWTILNTYYYVLINSN